jgi:hypothetical protein
MAKDQATPIDKGDQKMEHGISQVPEGPFTGATPIDPD